jgi:lysophospholipase L1-like esterase
VNRTGLRKPISVALAGLLGASVALGGAQVTANAAVMGSPSTNPPGKASDVGLRVVGLGDSVLTALDRCHCPGLLVDYAGLVADRLQERIQVQNEAHGAATSSDVLDVLRSDRVRDEVSTANLVIIFAGANDFMSAFDKVAHGSPAKYRYAPIAEHVQHNIAASIEEIRRLNSQAQIVVCGYWNDFKDGAVARREYSKARRQAAAEATRYTNDALYRAAQDDHVEFLSTLHLFRSRGDFTPYLAADGDHLSAKGHALIAQALADLLHPDDSDNSGDPLGLNQTH